MVSLALVTLACPDCEAGRAARELVLESGLVTDLGLALAPFVVCAVVVRAIVRRVDHAARVQRMAAIDRVARLARAPRDGGAP